MRSILYYIVSKIKKLQNKDTEIDTEISGIKQDITDINGDITNINGDITDINGDITDIKGDISKLSANGQWFEIETNNGNLYYKQLSTNLYYIRGEFTGLTENINIDLPFTVTNKMVFMLAGSGNYYTKAYTTAGQSRIGIAVGTGTSATSYSLNTILVTN